MTEKGKKFIICFGLIALLLFIDQAVKIWIKCNFAIGESVNLIGDWCQLYFVENEGIAFGISFGQTWGKLILTLFRLIASIFIVFFLIKRIKKGTRLMLLISVSLIFVGAVGNLIDSCFYGLIFSESTTSQIATLFPAEGGYGRFLYGRVVDMFYFPIVEWVWPDWVPFFGGEHAEFFSAIFNVADAAVCTGVALLTIDQLKNDKKVKAEKAVSEVVVEEVEKEGVIDGQISEKNEQK